MLVRSKIWLNVQLCASNNVFRSPFIYKHDSINPKKIHVSRFDIGIHIIDQLINPTVNMAHKTKNSHNDKNNKSHKVNDTLKLLKCD